MMARRAAALGAALAALVASPALADVQRSSDTDFAVSGSEAVAISPDEVWQRLVRPAEWWSAEHTWSGDAANLSLDPQAGGCFCETLPGGGSVEHMRVIHAAPGKLLRMVGTLGPLQSETLTGVLSVTVESSGDGAKLTWTYKVAGKSDIPLADLAPVVDSVVGSQFRTLADGTR